MMPVSWEGCCHQGSNGYPFFATSSFVNDCYVSNKWPYESASGWSKTKVGQDGVPLLGGSLVADSILLQFMGDTVSFSTEHNSQIAHKITDMLVPLSMINVILHYKVRPPLTMK